MGFPLPRRSPLSESAVRDVVIVGSGPAGLTAAIYAARARLAPLCIEGVQRGGQLMLTSDVENYPGFEEGVQGPDLMDRFRKQAARFGTEFLQEDATEVDFSRRPFTVRTAGAEFRARAVIVSTGAAARMLGLPSEKALLGRGVTTCATCDGAFYRDRVVAVVGGGDSAMEEANFLTRFASRVHLLHRSDRFRASRIMLDRARANPKIEFRPFREVKEVLDGGKGKVTGVRLADPRDGRTEELAVDGFFLAIGHVPSTRLFEGKLELDREGYIVCRPDSSRTSVEGVFACGDCVDHEYRQAITAAGMGCRAAIDCERWLETQGR
jgi:thioredoxin reductase (NADPH)